MPVVGFRSINSCLEKAEARKKKKTYWEAKGCSNWKAEKLLQRYGY